ncbi:MAG: aminotransferase class I/II-fold pyridoxal phosphate-dependent enzyme [Simkaniaceae bacterium]|nr:aminotransferase class I/II-fold pyridoxal phosphate-dependent enzyme [Simkaniaceae bacterium]
MATQTIETHVTFLKSVEDSFEFLKAPLTYHELFSRTIPLPEDFGCLLPVAHLHLKDEKLIHSLAKWREINTFAFPTRFPVTFEGTRLWLYEHVLANPHRMLFLVLDRVGQVVGHLGFAEATPTTLKIDNVIRGVRDATPGIMSVALKAMITWAQKTLFPQKLLLNVLSDNTHAVKFYEKNGFVTDRETPLRKEVNGDRVHFVPCTRGEEDKTFLTMRYVPNPSKETILTAGPSISEREVSYVHDAVREGWNAQASGSIQAFERAFAQFIGAEHTIATASCHGALHIALAALGIGSGDEVIVPDLTWVASASVITYVGATPIFADVDPDTLTLDPSSLKEAITERTKAVIPVHLYGHPANMEAICKCAREHNLFVIEDAAPAIGAKCGNQTVGTFGDFAAFSFHGAKLLVTGEGGMLVAKTAELHEKALRIANQGRVPGTFWIEEIGLKYKMSNIQAALGLAQLERIDSLIAKKRQIFAWYKENLDDIPWFRLIEEAPWAKSIYWMPTIVLEEEAPYSVRELCQALDKAKIDSRPIFPQISQYPMWPDAENVNAAIIGGNGLNLPSGVCLQKEDILRVCRALRSLS